MKRYEEPSTSGLNWLVLVVAGCLVGVGVVYFEPNKTQAWGTPGITESANRLACAAERSATADERTAAALERIAEALEKKK